MAYGLRLTGTHHDIAALYTLSDALSPLLSEPWTEITSETFSGSVIRSDQVHENSARELAARGLDVVEIKEEGKGLRLTPLADPKQTDFWPRAILRPAQNLLEALRPIKLPRIPTAEAACFLVPVENPGAQKTLSRLLALGRDDAVLSEWIEGEARLLIVRVENPPLYLLMRAREEAEEGVRAYASAGELFWVEWGYAYPLPTVAVRSLQSARRAAFVDADGAWRYAPAEWRTRSIYDALLPEFRAPRVELTPSPEETRFTIPLRLEAGPETEPELWLLTPEDLFSLESFVETASPEELGRLTTARTTGPEGVRYVLREMVRPNIPRVGSRISDILEKRGFYRSAGTDNLYLPVGRRLLPAMRRDDLRALLALDQASAVLIDEDSGGPKIFSLKRLDEVPLRSWLEYVVTDRRLELDRLLEESVFAFPEVAVARPPKEEAKEEERVRIRPPRPVAPPPPKPRKQERVERAPERPEAAEDASLSADARDEARAIREEIRAREKLVVEGGCTAIDTWQTLGRLKAQIGEIDEAALCLEAALFYSGDPGFSELPREIAALRARLAQATGSQEELLDLVVKRALTPSEASYLGARLLAQLASGEPTLEGLFQQAARIFAGGDLPVSRRLAWLVLSSYYRRTDDKLGLTRAKESLLGSLNDRGLNDAFDLPGFVRFALALEGDDQSDGALARTRADQLAALETLWAYALERHIHELDALSAYARLAFAMGFVRLGAPSRARDLVDPVENELPVHDPPNRVLFRLYMAKLAHTGAKVEGQSPWEQEVEAALSTLPDMRSRDAVEWLRKQSEWLKGEVREENIPWIRSDLEKLISQAENGKKPLAPTLLQVMESREYYDYEVVAAIERLSRTALKSGNDELIHEVLWSATGKLSRIKILGHRAQAIGICLRSAATLGDADTVDRLLHALVEIASSPDRPSVRELMTAVRPGLAALRRLGVGDAAAKLLNSLAPIAAEGGREGAQLGAALADGFMQLKDTARAEEILERALEDTLSSALEYTDRYKSAAAILDALTHWPMTGRTPRGQRLLENLDHFRDTFTVGRFYPTFKVLLLEKLIDAVSDEVTLRSDRVQSFLDAEEQAIRRQILADWNKICGR